MSPEKSFFRHGAEIFKKNVENLQLRSYKQNLQILAAICFQMYANFLNLFFQGFFIKYKLSLNISYEYKLFEYKFEYKLSFLQK